VTLHHAGVRATSSSAKSPGAFLSAYQAAFSEPLSWGEKDLEKLRRPADVVIGALLPGDSLPQPPPELSQELPEPAHRSTSSELYFRPVSVTIQCVMTLAFASLLLYSGLTASRNLDELSGRFHPSLRTEVLAVASRPASLASMLCVLFVACRMLILAVTEGLGEPEPWVKACMYISTGGLLLEVLQALLLPWMLAIETDGPPEAQTWDVEADSRGNVYGCNFREITADEKDGHCTWQGHIYHGTCARMLALLLQVVSKVGLYGGIAGIMANMLGYVPWEVLCLIPIGRWRAFYSQPTVAGAAPAVLILTFLYFFAFLVLWIARSVSTAYRIRQDAGAGSSEERLEVIVSCARAMANVARKAPMLGILCLTSRMRDLELQGSPTHFVQLSFWCLTKLLLVEMLLAAVAEAWSGSARDKAERPGTLAVARHVLGLLGILILIPVAAGVAHSRNSEGSIVPLSTTTVCTLCLMSLYFSLHAARHLLSVLQGSSSRWQETLKNVQVGVNFTPHLCVLFLVTRMRSLQITQRAGDPQAWAQDAMIVTVFATTVQAICCLLLPVFTGSVLRVDEDGHPDYDLQPMIGAFAVNMVKWMALLSIHFCVLALCCAIYLMTPETAMAPGGHIIDGGPFLLRAVSVALAILLVSLLFSSAKVVGLAAKWALESCDRAVCGVDITAGHVALGLCKGYIKLKDVVIHQPQEEMIFTKSEDGQVTAQSTGQPTHWKQDYLMRARLILIKINLWRLLRTFGKEVELTDLAFSGVSINIEKLSPGMSNLDSNLHYITTPEISISTSVKRFRESKVVVHRLELGDAACVVDVRNIPVVGSISFRSTLGMIRYDNVQKQIFEERQDLTLKKAILLITRALMSKLRDSALKQIPHQIRRSTSHATASCTDPCLAAIAPYCPRKA